MVLPRFMVPDESQVLVPEQLVREAVQAMFVAVGMAVDDAAECADVLIASDLRGNDSHGVSNMLREYIGGFLRGRPDRGYRIGGPIYDCNPRPRFRTVRERPGTAVIDADGALGIHVAPHAMRVAIAKAKVVGSGSVVVRNAGHFGAIGYFAKMAAEAGCVGQVMLSSGGNMPPTFGASPRLGTNPCAWAAPAGSEVPLMLDMATTQVCNIDDFSPLRQVADTAHLVLARALISHFQIRLNMHVHVYVRRTGCGEQARPGFSTRRSAACELDH